MPLGLSGAGRLPAIGEEHTRCEGAMSSSCCALRTYRRRRYTGWNVGRIHPTRMALQLHKYKPLIHGYCPVCKHPRWLPASQSITSNPFPSCEGMPLRSTCYEGVPYFLFRQKVGKNHATRSLWQNPFHCPFPGRRSQSASLHR